MAELPIPTLVDCGCTTRVYGDHSGVEIEYCDEHAAAPDLLAACRLALECCQYANGERRRSWDQAFVRERIEAAIAKAEGGA